jgi:hypothetical protein
MNLPPQKHRNMGVAALIERKIIKSLKKLIAPGVLLQDAA